MENRKAVGARRHITPTPPMIDGSICVFVAKFARNRAGRCVCGELRNWRTEVGISQCIISVTATRTQQQHRQVT